MSEFNNRIDLQREVVKIVNEAKYKYEITGLSKNAIERWIMDNGLDSDSEIGKLLLNISSKLFFLANKSQEQITEDYKKTSTETSNLVQNLKDKIAVQG